MPGKGQKRTSFACVETSAKTTSRIIFSISHITPRFCKKNNQLGSVAKNFNHGCR